ncbi:DUF3558 domain-containing protein [Nocardia cyriacigeorgica]|uniref:DUF3558 domain-containing protein n=1 Tax=Nocardia cyriacigeorgica TaxID=135487 RepID=A0ABX0CQ25_9NOCA|nr:DUF3558 domain-containing protein [Nocardia cyriacigeorgica]NEW58594.1 DUF3558 domain-containing protein [Nocardia cyriacigeorgica]
MKSRIIVGALLAAGVMTVGACAGTTDGTPTTAEATTQQQQQGSSDIEIFNPCDGLSDSALSSAGLDPSTERVTTDAPSGPATWRVCSWKPAEPDPTYRVIVFSTSHTLDEARKNEDLTGFESVTVAGRTGFTSFDKSDTARTRCYVNLPAEQGMVEVAASWLETGTKPDVCGLAVQYATALEPHLPE